MSWAAAIGGSIALTGVVASEYNKSQEKKAIDNAPKYQIPNEVYQNHDIAMRQAIMGLPSATKNLHNLDRDKLLTNEIGNQHDLKSGLIGLAGATDRANYSDALFEDANGKAQLEGYDKLQNANKEIANLKGVAYQLNELNPYLAKIKVNETANQNDVNALMMGGSMIGGSMGKSKGATGVGQNNIQPVASNNNSTAVSPYTGYGTNYSFENGTPVYEYGID